MSWELSILKSMNAIHSPFISNLNRKSTANWFCETNQWIFSIPLLPILLGTGVCKDKMIYSWSFPELHWLWPNCPLLEMHCCASDLVHIWLWDRGRKFEKKLCILLMYMAILISQVSKQQPKRRERCSLSHSTRDSESWTGSVWGKSFLYPHNFKYQSLTILSLLDVQTASAGSTKGVLL